MLLYVTCLVVVIAASSCAFFVGRTQGSREANTTATPPQGAAGPGAKPRPRSPTVVYQPLTYPEVKDYLLVHGLTPFRAQRLVDRAGDAGVAPVVMSIWIQTFGVRTLETVIDADLGHAEMLRHLTLRELPDMRTLRLLARLRNQQEDQDHHAGGAIPPKTDGT